jgi:hypothetical protein
MRAMRSGAAGEGCHGFGGKGILSAGRRGFAERVGRGMWSCWGSEQAPLDMAEVALGEDMREGSEGLDKRPRSKVGLEE